MTARRDLVAPSLPAAPPSTAIIWYRSATVTGKPVSGSSTGWPRSAVPAAALYSSVPADVWAPFATLVLEAADEATLWAAVQNAQQGGARIASSSPDWAAACSATAMPGSMPPCGGRCGGFQLSDSMCASSASGRLCSRYRGWSRNTSSWPNAWGRLILRQRAARSHWRVAMLREMGTKALVSPLVSAQKVTLTINNLYL